MYQLLHLTQSLAAELPQQVTTKEVLVYSIKSNTMKSSANWTWTSGSKGCWLVFPPSGAQPSLLRELLAHLPSKAFFQMSWKEVLRLQPLVLGVLPTVGILILEIKYCKYSSSVNNVNIHIWLGLHVSCIFFVQKKIPIRCWWDCLN